MIGDEKQGILPSVSALLKGIVYPYRFGSMQIYIIVVKNLQYGRSMS
jgi:hypothetical protein